MSRLARWAVAPALLALAACQDTLPTGENSALRVSDAEHTIADQGGDPNANPFFYFLPPLVPSPSYDGEFNPSHRPSIEVYELPNGAGGYGCTAAGGIGDLVRRFEFSEISVDPVGEMYSVGWQTGDDGLTHGDQYRICVKSAGVYLGYRDIQPEENGADVPRNPDQLPVLQFNNGSNLPIKFRIEKGALCGLDGATVIDCTETYLDADGGTAVCTGSLCGLQVPDSALTTEYLFVVELVQCTTEGDHIDYLDIDLPQFSGCLRINVRGETDFAGLLKDGIAAACLDETGLTAQQQDLVQLHAQFPDGTVQSLPTAASDFLDCEGFVGKSAPGGTDPGLLSYLESGWNALVRAVSPRSLVATHKGFGGSTSLSGDAAFAASAAGDAVAGDTREEIRFAWALPAQMERVDWTNPQIGSVGDRRDPTVYVMTDPVDVGVSATAVQNALVTFTMVTGDPFPVPFEDPVEYVTTLSVRTDGTGLASVPWVLSPAGLLQIRASGRGIGVSPTNVPAGFGSFQSHFGNPDYTLPNLLPRTLGTGALYFDALVCDPDLQGAVVDGQISDADHYNNGNHGTHTSVKISGGETGATFYVTYDCANLYVALAVQADSSIANAFRIVFDNDGDDIFGSATAGVDPYFELNDDVLKIERAKNGTWTFSDRYIPERCRDRNGQSDCSVADPTQPPAGSFAVGWDADLFGGAGGVVYELQRSLNSGDVHDFQIDLGRPGGTTVGYFWVVQMGSGAQGNTEFPSFQQYAPLTFTAPELP